MIILTNLFATTDPTSLWGTAQSGGLVGVLVYLVVGFVNEWLVPGKTHRRAIEERDRALEILDKEHENTRRALDVALQKGRK